MHFQIGKKVRLKSGSPEMTIIDVPSYAGPGGQERKYKCSWLDGSTEKRSLFPAEALVLVEDDELPPEGLMA